MGPVSATEWQCDCSCCYWFCSANVIVAVSGQRCSCLFPTATTDRETLLPFSPDVSPHRDGRLGWGHTLWPPRSVSPPPPRLRSFFFFLAAHVTSPLGKPEKPSRRHRSIRLVKSSSASTAATHHTAFHSRVTGHLLGDPSTAQGSSSRPWLEKNGIFTCYRVSMVLNQSNNPDLWPLSSTYFAPQNPHLLVIISFPGPFAIKPTYLSSCANVKIGKDQQRFVKHWDLQHFQEPTTMFTSLKVTTVPYLQQAAFPNVYIVISMQHLNNFADSIVTDIVTKSQRVSRFVS